MIDAEIKNQLDEQVFNDNVYWKMFQGCRRLDELPDISQEKIREDKKYIRKTLAKDYYLYHRPSIWEKIKNLFKNNDMNI